MKSNKWNLIAALLFLTAGICYVFAAVLQTGVLTKVLYSICAVAMLIGSIELFYTYMKKKKPMINDRIYQNSPDSDMKSSGNTKVN